MKNIINDFYVPMLIDGGFTPTDEDVGFNPLGTTWKISNKLGKGYYWTYGQKDLFDIKIHKFSFLKDTLLEFDIPECLSITHYESISGEELSPYRRLEAECIKTYVGGIKPYRIIVHKNIPIHSIGIEVCPAYYRDYLQKVYPDEFNNLESAFLNLDQTMDFPEIIHVFHQIANYKNYSSEAKLFFEGKIAEALSLVIKYGKNSNKTKNLSTLDKESIELVTQYLNDHYFCNISLDKLAKIACMGTTKLKICFKTYHSCTITQYIQKKRMSHAEHMLSSTDFTIGQISHMVGYSNASRFSELFKRTTGLSPNDYRKISKT